MAKFVIRNSDILFGRTVATYKFASRETIRNAIREVSSLQVLGIDKRLPQVTYERGYLSEHQIYAVMESLLQSHQVKRIPDMHTYLFTPEDEEEFLRYLGLSKDFYQRDILTLPSEVLEKDLPISRENLLLCLNIKQSLEKGGMHVSLLSVIHDKHLLNSRFQKIIPDIAQRRRTILSAQERDEMCIRRSVATLFSQVAILNGKMNVRQFQDSLLTWEKVTTLGLDLKYSELLFYLGYIDEESCERAASFLITISGIDQHPRFPLCRLSDREQGFFERIRQEGVFRADLLRKAEQMVSRLKLEGLQSIRVSDVLILEGYLSRKKIVTKWAEMRKKEIADKVRKLQMERTEEARTELEEMAQKLNDDMMQSREILKNAEDEISQYYRNAQVAGSEALSEQTEAHHFEKELDKTFRTTQEQQRKVLEKELDDFKARLGKADKGEARTINTVLEYYRRTHKSLTFYVALAVFLLFMMFLGFFFALREQILTPLPKSLPKEPHREQSPEAPVSPPPSDASVPKTNGEKVPMDTALTPPTDTTALLVPPGPKDEDPLADGVALEIVWQEFEKIEQECLLKRRQSCVQEVQGKAVLYRENWHEVGLTKTVAEMEKQWRDGFVWFQKTWYPKSNLGDWHEIVLVKGEEKQEGFLRQENPKKQMYEFRPSHKRTTRYYKGSEILYKKKGLSPWERYFSEYDQIGADDVASQRWFIVWCQTKDISDLTRFQIERLLSRAPNFPEVRHWSGYVWYKGNWQKEENLSSEEGVLNFQGIWMTLEQASRSCLIFHNGKWRFIEEAAWNSLPEPMKSMWQQGRISLLSGDYKKARQCLEEVCKSNPNSAMAWLDRGRVYLELNDVKTAYDNFSQALELDPKLANAYLGRGTVFQRQRRYDAAEGDFLKALELAPENILPYYALVLLYLEQGKREETLAMVRKADESGSDSQAAENLLRETEFIERKTQQSTMKVQGVHYIVYGDAPEIFGKAVCLWLEEICAHYALIYGLPSVGPWKVLIFAKREDLVRYIRLQYPQIAHNIIALWWPVTGELVVASDQHPIFLREALFSSSARQILACEKRDLPPWLYEGTMAYFGWAAEDKGEIHWDEVPSYWVRRVKNQDDGDAIPLSQILLLSSENFYRPENYSTNLLYSYTWLHFLVHAEEGKYRSLLKEYLKRIREGGTWTTAAAVFSEGILKDLNASYETYWNKM